MTMIYEWKLEPILQFFKNKLISLEYILNPRILLLIILNEVIFEWALI